MQSVFGGFTQEEIAQIRSGGEGHSRKRMTLYEALKEVAQSGRTVEEGEEISAGESAGEEAELSQKADTFLQRIGHYRDLTPFTSIRDLLQRILDDYDYLNLCDGTSRRQQAACKCGDAAYEGIRFREDQLFRTVSFYPLHGTTGKIRCGLR